jgi:dTDP-4-amino-4,6-dideoxygalactose transaminase
MNTIGAVAAEHGIPVVEDNAHGLFGRYRGRWLGTFGAMATLSFHETKNFSCGEGGALLLNDPATIERAEIVREKGTDRSKFFRGEVDRYTWVDIGSSYVPSDLLAAFLLGQLEARDEIQRRRRDVFERYEAALEPWARRHGIRTLKPAAGCEHPYHMFYLRLPGPSARRQFIDRLAAAGALAVSHYVPLHLSPVGMRYGYKPGDLPVTEAVSEQIVRLPFYACLTAADQERIAEIVEEQNPTALAEQVGG